MQEELLKEAMLAGFQDELNELLGVEGVDEMEKEAFLGKLKGLWAGARAGAKKYMQGYGGAGAAYRKANKAAQTSHHIGAAKSLRSKATKHGLAGNPIREGIAQRRMAVHQGAADKLVGRTPLKLKPKASKPAVSKPVSAPKPSMLQPTDVKPPKKPAKMFGSKAQTPAAAPKPAAVTQPVAAPKPAAAPDAPAGTFEDKVKGWWKKGKNYAKENPVHAAIGAGTAGLAAGAILG